MIAVGHVLDCNVFISCRVIRFVVRHVKYFLGVRYQVSGWEHLQTDGPYVIISNHQSSLDVLGERIHSTNQHNTVCSVLLLLLPQDQICMTRPAWTDFFLCAHPDVTWWCLCSQSFCADSLLLSAGMMEILPDRCTMIAKKELIWAGRWAWFAGWEESSSSTAERPAMPRTSCVTPLKPCWPTRSVFAKISHLTNGSLQTINSVWTTSLFQKY